MCEILKVPIFVHVFFILIRKDDEGTVGAGKGGGGSGTKNIPAKENRMKQGL